METEQSARTFVPPPDSVEETVAAGKKKLWLAYALALPVGWLGVHRFYLRRRATGITMLVISVVALLIAAFSLIALKTEPLRGLLCDAAAGLLLLVTVLWELIDLIRMPFIARRVHRGRE